MPADPLFRKLVECHPERIREGAWRYLLPVPHALYRRTLRALNPQPSRKPVKMRHAVLPTTDTFGLISLDELMRQICEKHQLTRIEVCSISRNRKLVEARHELCYRAATETISSYPKIGKFIGNRDHTTVINSIDQWCRKNDLPRPRGMAERIRVMKVKYGVEAAARV